MNHKFQVDAKGESLTGYVCHDYLQAYWVIKYFKFAVPLLIEGINIVVKVVTKLLAEWIKYDNASKMIS